MTDTIIEKDTILVTIGEDHSFNCSVVTIGRTGENAVSQLEIEIPKELASFDAFLEFKKPKGQTTRTPKITVQDNRIEYDIPQSLLDENGNIEVQLILQGENGEIWKSATKKYVVLKSIDAGEDIPDSQKEDFFSEAQRTMDNLASVCAPVIKETVVGSAVSMPDVSPLEHNIVVKLKSDTITDFSSVTLKKCGKNFLDLTSLIGKSVTANGGTLSCGADGGIRGSGTVSGYVGFNSFRLYLPKGKYILSASGTFSNISCAIVLNDENGKVLQEAGVVSSGGGFSFNTENYPSFAYITVTIKRNNNVALSGTAYFQIEEGTTATAYAPYVADVSSVTLTKCGSNLIDFSAWENRNARGISMDYEGDGVFHIYGTTDSQGAIQDSPIAISTPAVHDVNYYLSATLLEGSTEVNFQPYIGVNDGNRRNWDAVTIRPTTKIGDTVTISQKSNYQYPNVKTFDRFWLYFGTVEAGKTIDCRVRVWFGLGKSGEYEPFQCETYNGTVESVPSLYPTTTLLTDTDGVTITAEYNCDTKKYIDKKLAQLVAATASEGVL